MDLVLVDEIGSELHKALFFFNNENRVIIERLKHIIQFEVVEIINPNATVKLAGKVFVVSGFLKNSQETI
jgi:DNA ligase (NAD+)